MRTKHIKNYIQFLVEQDMGMSAMPGVEGVAPKKEKPFKFIFLDDIDDSMDKAKKYPDGTKEYSFITYSVMPQALEDWVKKNILSTDKTKLSDSELELRQQNVINIVKGEKLNISDQDTPFIDKLRNAVSTDIFGKKEPDTTVLFTKNFLPTTEQIDITFIKYKK